MGLRRPVVALLLASSCADAGFSWPDHDRGSSGEDDGGTAGAEPSTPNGPTWMPIGSSSCIARDGDTYCWGEAPVAGPEATSSRAQALSLGASTPAGAVGGGHACVVLVDGRLVCWGSNTRGQLGVGDSIERPAQASMDWSAPTVDLPGPVVSICAGRWFTCAATSAEAFCWGGVESLVVDASDAIGDEPGEIPERARIDLGDIDTIGGLACGDNHVCALLEGGAVKCWGENYIGQLGYGDRRSRGETIDTMGDALGTVDLAEATTALAAGGDTTCALGQSGALRCWGEASMGVLGTGDREDRGDEPGELGPQLLPINLAEDQPVVTAAVAETHACAVLGDGDVKCWGHNARGELGQGHTESIGGLPGQMGHRLPPVNLGKHRWALALGVAKHLTCVARDNGTVVCWGESVGDKPGEMGRYLDPIEF